MGCTCGHVNKYDLCPNVSETFKLERERETDRQRQSERGREKATESEREGRESRWYFSSVLKLYATLNKYLQEKL